MEFIQTTHPQILRIVPDVYPDERGYFMVPFEKSVFQAAGLDINIVQSNQSSSKLGTLRGLHYQITHPQGKLLRVVRGKIFDVGVDLRRSSPWFGRWAGAILSEENKEMFWVPPGFAHGFLALSERADVVYQTTDIYAPESERCIRWDDPELAIEWPLTPEMQILISDKDRHGLLFSEAETYP